MKSGSMPRVALFDVDSRVPNLALMKLSAYYKTRGWEVVLSTKPVRIEAHKYFAGHGIFPSELKEADRHMPERGLCAMDDTCDG